MPRGFGLFGPVVAWAAVLFWASSQSEIGMAGRVPDWITHGIAYLVLGLLIARALAGGFPRPLPGRRALAVVALASLYGVSDEYHQSFVPGRDASAGDVAKDFAGSLLGALAYRRAARDSPAAAS